MTSSLPHARASHLWRWSVPAALMLGLLAMAGACGDDDASTPSDLADTGSLSDSGLTGAGTVPGGGTGSGGADPGGTGPGGTTPGSVDPGGSGSGSADPTGSGPGSMDPSGSGAGSADPSGSGPGSADPTGSGPGSMDPSGSGAGSADPSGSGAGSADPSGSGPGSMDPSGTEPVGTEPVGTEPVGTEPVGTEPVGTEPGGTEPGGTEPGGTEPADIEVAGNFYLQSRFRFGNTRECWSTPRNWDNIVVEEADDGYLVTIPVIRESPPLSCTLEEDNELVCAPIFTQEQFSTHRFAYVFNVSIDYDTVDEFDAHVWADVTRFCTPIPMNRPENCQFFDRSECEARYRWLASRRD